MRSILTLSFLLLAIYVLPAQVILEQTPLESNPVLQHQEALRLQAQEEKLVRLFGEEVAESRTTTHNCEDDGIYESGETVFILSGEQLEICLDTTGFVTFDNISVDGNFGSTSTNENCITYTSNGGVDLGIGDTLKVELCLPNGGDCSVRTFPVVVKREDANFIEPAVSLNAETDLSLCVSPANYILPSGITSSLILNCHNPEFVDVSNGNTKDSCALLSAQRAAGQDTVCLKISNDFCISDTYKFPFRVTGDTLGLPFMDDFSYAGPYPNKLWLDKKTFVNNSWGYQPPSVGFATFDGLDETGTPYGGGYGRSDALTSNYIDLSPYNAGSNVYLSCFAQPKGYGYEPGLADSLVVEFKKSNGDWVRIHTFQGLGGGVPFDSLPGFDNFFSFPIISSDYFYDGFQFRFVNYGERRGIFEIWHVDYVRLNANEVPDGSFEDIAFTNLPNFILKRYSSMPYSHFENPMLLDSIDIELYSHFDVIESAEPSGMVLRELETGAVFDDIPTLLLDQPENQRNVPPQTHKFHRNARSLMDITGLSLDKLVFELEYTFEVDGQNPGFFPVVARNDTVKRQTVFDNYFAYDDGSAEVAIFIGNIGQAVASEFEATHDDSLRAVQIHFPRYSSMESATFNLRVHVGSLGNVVYEKFLLKPFFPDTVLDTLQGFTTYRLSDDFDNPTAVAIPPGPFFIELAQASTQQLVLIGFDLNTPKAIDYQYFRNGSNWILMGNKGASMIRPVVGNFTPPNTPVDELLAEDLMFNVYPNPSNGIMNLDIGDEDISDFEISIFNSIGQLMKHQKLDNLQLDMSMVENGVYYLQLKNLKTRQFTTRKVLIYND